MASGNIFPAIWPNTKYPTFLLFWVLVGSAYSEILTPPYFNLAENRRITATATCGDAGPELYCKFGLYRDSYDRRSPIPGENCDYCDMNDSSQRHPVEFAIDGSDRWWQSPPLARGNQFNEVNVTIDFPQEFAVAYVFITFGNAPRPGVWALERSTDYGATFTPWQYFAENTANCKKFFGTDSKQITHDDSVICDTSVSRLQPLENGEVVVSLVSGRPSANDFFESDNLQNWVKATNIRLRLLRTITVKGRHNMDSNKNTSIPHGSQNFYSIKDISIGGRCRCNGHADLCDITDPQDPYKLLCRCQHNTCGDQCEKCCPGFMQKAWGQERERRRSSCEVCNCHDHSYECYYDEEVEKNKTSLNIHGRYDGGGVCVNCQDNTEGINCEKCKPGYFRRPGKDLRARDTCQQCSCDKNGTVDKICDSTSGKCSCRKGFGGQHCGQCLPGYFNFPDCKPCNCNTKRTTGKMCDANGQCPCLANFAGRTCDQCSDDHFLFPACLHKNSVANSYIDRKQSIYWKI